MSELDQVAASGPAIVESIEAVSGGCAVWLADIWGVMHNGVRPFEEAVAACQTFRKQGGLVILLSNAPRPAEAVAGQLAKIGVASTAWDTIISSGDATRAMLSSMDGPAFHLGPDRDLPIYEGLPVTLADETEAHCVVCTGLFDDETETPGDYLPLLHRFLARGAPMICANPDITVERGGRVIYCAGAIAAEYEKLGGKVTYCGKPYKPVYDMAFAWLAERLGRSVTASDFLAIGDGVKTDIAGAANLGIRSVYIASAVHMPEHGSLDRATLLQLFPDSNRRPIAAMSRLAW